MNIPASWTPTVENINDLPLALRRYIHGLETKNDLLQGPSARILGFTKKLRLKSARGLRGKPELPIACQKIYSAPKSDTHQST